jgi:hypothetical protein
MAKWLILLIFIKLTLNLANGIRDYQMRNRDMNRLNTIAEVDIAIDQLDAVRESLIDLACPLTLANRVQHLLHQLEDLRIDILRADLAGEQEVIFIPK